MRLAAAACFAPLVLAILAGCAGSSETSTTSQSSSAPVKVITHTVSLGSGQFSLTPPAFTQSFPLTVKENATHVEATLTADTSFTSNLSITVDDCGTYSSQGITGGTGGNAYSGTICDEISAGTHTVTISVQAGVAQGSWQITGTAKVVKGMAGNATASA